MSESKSILIDDLPTTLCGSPFNSDHRSIIRFFELQAEDVEEDEKARKITELLFPDGAPDDEKLGDELRTFITMGEDVDSGGERVFDFRVDAARIYASFYQAYKIDLAKEKIHWWAFVSLFNALPDDTIIRKVIDIRTKKIEPSMSPKERTALMKAKDRFSLDKGDNNSYAGLLFRRN